LATDKTEIILFYTISYLCENSLFYFCCYPDPVLEGAKHPDLVSKGMKHIHFSQFSSEKKYDLQHPKPDLASLDGTTSTVNICLFSIIFLFTK
jgi:hypothetical protein